MTTSLLNLSQARDEDSGNLSGLQAYLAQLIGEPFQFARVSYGDELTLHFGDLRPARSPKLMKHNYGAYVLGVRGSAWLLKAGIAPWVLSAGINPGSASSKFGDPVRKEDLEANPLIQAGGRVLFARMFVVKDLDAIGLQLRITDGSDLLILPTLADIDEPDDTVLPTLADWELISPNGLLNAGPGLTWSYKPSRSDGSN